MQMSNWNLMLFDDEPQLENKLLSCYNKINERESNTFRGGEVLAVFANKSWSVSLRIYLGKWVSQPQLIVLMDLIIRMLTQRNIWRRIAGKFNVLELLREFVPEIFLFLVLWKTI